MLRPVRRSLAALAVVLVVPALGACQYQTDQVYQPAVGVNNRSGVVDVLGAVVVSGADGSGIFAATLVNKDDAKAANLTKITGPQGLTIQVVKQVEVEPEGLTNMADLGAVSVTGPDVVAGHFVRLTLTFDTGQSTKLNVPVVSKTGEFTQVRPVLPSASATP